MTPPSQIEILSFHLRLSCTNPVSVHSAHPNLVELDILVEVVEAVGVEVVGEDAAVALGGGNDEGSDAGAEVEEEGAVGDEEFGDESFPLRPLSRVPEDLSQVQPVRGAVLQTRRLELLLT